MACQKCLIRVSPRIRSHTATATKHRSFHVSTPRQRLGAATYHEEWQTGSYHYNKQTTKNHPVAAQTANRLLEMYATMQKPTSATLAAQRTAIASRRRSMDKFFVSGTTAKDFGDRIVLDAFVYDAGTASRTEKAQKMAQEKAAKEAKAAQRAQGGAVTGNGRGRTGSSPGAGRPRRQFSARQVRPGGAAGPVGGQRKTPSKRPPAGGAPGTAVRRIPGLVRPSYGQSPPIRRV